ncbi:Copia protein [Eumeta japonica]|uniref:Copia protein n=1 Tax=Eumeta variegata TaxID=151549 RepID=A0A4C1VQ22_EUMVA|nr:Copia protein [Eumeta japonica]
MFIITSSMDFKQITLIENCETAKEIMEKLESIYEQKSELCKMLIHEKFYQYKMSENDSVAQHISKVENLAKQLKESGESVSEMAIITKIIGTLPLKYRSIRQAWMSLDPTQQTLNNLTARLLDEESSLASVEEQETALLVVNKGWKNVPKQNGPRSCGSGTSQNKTTKHRFECYNCGKRGHFSKECRFPKQNKPRKHLKESSDMLAFNVEISSYNTEENAWIMDSGASAHMTFRKDFFVELLKCSEKSLTLGNKQSVEVSGIGKVLIKRYVNGQWETSELHGVLILHTDNGREYVNKVFKEYLDKEGIVHELTAPYTPEQNGREREIRTIVESARSMLYARDLPLDLWAEAVNCAVYILNRTSSSQTPGKTPYELWNGTKPELGHLKVFGSIDMSMFQIN